jgi:hypothetical protein
MGHGCGIRVSMHSKLLYCLHVSTLIDHERDPCEAVRRGSLAGCASSPSTTSHANMGLASKLAAAQGGAGGLPQSLQAGSLPTFGPFVVHSTDESLTTGRPAQQQAYPPPGGQAPSYGGAPPYGGLRGESARPPTDVREQDSHRASSKATLLKVASKAPTLLRAVSSTVRRAGFWLGTDMAV